MTNSNNLNNAVIEYFKTIGGMAWRNNTGAFSGQYTDTRGVTRQRFVRYGQKGSGDVLALYRGVFFSIETKSAHDRVRESQSEWMDEVRRHGGVAIVARSIDDVISAVNELSE